MSLKLGDFKGEILGHGTDTSQTGLPFVWVRVKIRGQPEADEEQYARLMLASDNGEEKTRTCIRMTRAALKLCGFDIDTRDLSELDNEPGVLVGNEVPISVSQSGKYTNVNIQNPRGVTKEQARSITEQLRAARGKDEKPLPPPQPAGTSPGPDLSQYRVKPQDLVAPDDVPF